MASKSIYKVVLPGLAGVLFLIMCMTILISAVTAYTVYDYETFDYVASGTDLQFHDFNLTPDMAGCEAQGGELSCAALPLGGGSIIKEFNIYPGRCITQNGVINGNPANFSVFYRFTENRYFANEPSSSDTFYIGSKYVGFPSNTGLVFLPNNTNFAWLVNETLTMVGDAGSRAYPSSVLPHSGATYEVQIDYLMRNWTDGAPNNYVLNATMWVNGNPGEPHHKALLYEGGIPATQLGCFNNTKISFQYNGITIDTMILWVYDAGEAFTNANDTPPDVYTLGQNQMPTWDYSLTNRNDVPTNIVGISAATCTADQPAFMGSLSSLCSPLLLNYYNVVDAESNQIYQALDCDDGTSIFTDLFNDEDNVTYNRYFINEDMCNTTIQYYDGTHKGMYFYGIKPAYLPHDPCFLQSVFSSDKTDGYLLDSTKDYMLTFDMGLGSDGGVATDFMDYNTNWPISLQYVFNDATSKLEIYNNFVLWYEADGFTRAGTYHAVYAINGQTDTLSVRVYQDSGATFQTETYGFAWPVPIERFFFYGVADDATTYEDHGEYIGNIQLIQVHFPDYYTWNTSVEYACESNTAGNFTGYQYFTDSLRPDVFSNYKTFNWKASVVASGGNINTSVYTDDAMAEAWDDVFQHSSTLKTLFVILCIIMATLACVYVGQGTIFSLAAAAIVDVAVLFLFSYMGMVASWIVWMIVFIAAVITTAIVMKVTPAGDG